MESEPRPRASVGRIVHYYVGDPNKPLDGPLAAIITQVEYRADDTVRLMVFSNKLEPKSMVIDAPYSAEPKAFHWSWPPRT